MIYRLDHRKQGDSSVVFLVETADISSDESMDDVGDSENGRMVD
jgi:hypothetical protein